MAQNRRLIDAEALYDKAEAKYKMSSGFYRPIYRGFVDDIADAPTVDAVEVVRCKDCQHWQQYNACDGTRPFRCTNHDGLFYKLTAPTDFCSRGERMDNECSERHGRWLSPVIDRYGCVCSVCKMQADNDFHYCPNCGAKMDLEG